ncbi:hypothetical protein DM860_006594 [Cuscuta australis]|uniref:Uncharacterized protein n=1 Tax=Cuscuta australis TaxID=267555 RepID=A0A328D535_9ASTE|nr:hypothetical protein DM860_006594 [Cuscuta australis]
MADLVQLADLMNSVIRLCVSSNSDLAFLPSELKHFFWMIAYFKYDKRQQKLKQEINFHLSTKLLGPARMLNDEDLMHMSSGFSEINILEGITLITGWLGNRRLRLFE